METRLNPYIKGYDWSNLVAVDQTEAAGCTKFCFATTYNPAAHLKSLTSGGEPCFCLGVDLTDPVYQNCFCSVAANAAVFPCTCMDATTKVFTHAFGSIGTPGVRATAATCQCLNTEVQLVDPNKLCYRETALPATPPAPPAPPATP